MTAHMLPIGLSDAKARDKAERDFCEPGVNMPVYSSGLATAVIRDGAVHLTFFVEQDNPNGIVEAAINLRCVIPVTGWNEARRMVDKAASAFMRGLDG